MLAAILAVALAAAGAAATEVDSAPRPVEVRFDGPEGCSSATAFLNSLRSRSNRVRGTQGDEARTTIEVRLSREHARVLGELRIVGDRDETNTRRVQGASCSDVVQALSLTAALALDPTALLSAPAAAGDTESASGENQAKSSAVEAPSVTPPPPVPIVTTAPPAPPPAPRPIPSTELGASAVALSILSGSISPGVEIEARRTFRRQSAFRPTLGLALAYARNDVLQTPQEAQASLATAAASLCPSRLGAGIVTVAPCALVMGGWLSATGRQVTHAGTANRSWLAAGLTVRAGIFLGRGVALQVEAGLAAIVLRRRFFATMPSNVIAETPTISPILGIGFVWGT